MPPISLDHLLDVSTPLLESTRGFQLIGHDFERHTPVYIRSHSISEQKRSSGALVLYVCVSWLVAEAAEGCIGAIMGVLGPAWPPFLPWWGPGAWHRGPYLLLKGPKFTTAVPPQAKHPEGDVRPSGTICVREGWISTCSAGFYWKPFCKGHFLSLNLSVSLAFLSFICWWCFSVSPLCSVSPPSFIFLSILSFQLGLLFLRKGDPCASDRFF